MANAKQCDICSCFYAAHKLSKRLRGYGMCDTAVITIFDPDADAEYPGELEDIQVSIETCPECMRRIKEYINVMKENKNE